MGYGQSCDEYVVASRQNILKNDLMIRTKYRTLLIVWLQDLPIFGREYYTFYMHDQIVPQQKRSVGNHDDYQ